MWSQATEHEILTMSHPLSQDVVAHLHRAARLPMSLAIACVVLDALTAYPPSHMDLVGPSAMRITALVLVVCTAAPMVCPRYASTQICILSSCLIVVAWTGLHQGTIYCRLTDASYIIIVGLLLFISSVFNNTHTAGHKQGVVHPVCRRFVFHALRWRETIATCRFDVCRGLRQSRHAARSTGRRVERGWLLCMQRVCCGVFGV